MARNTRCTKVESLGASSNAKRAESSSISRSRASALKVPRICSIMSIDIVIHLSPHAASAYDLLYNRQKLVRVEWLYDPARCACRLALLFFLRMRFRGQQNDGNEFVLRHRP